MPRLQVIVLEQLDPRNYRYALWADVPISRQSFYADAALKSAWAGATATDNTNLQSGVMTEKVDAIQIPTAWTLAQVEAELASRAADFQVYITGHNPWVRYGSNFDGTTWTVTGVV